MNKVVLPVLFGLLLAGPALAQELALRIDHESTTLGSDGVTRSARFSERLIRDGRHSWVERIVPAGAPKDGDAQGGERHKHLDVGAASRWVERSDNGTLRVRVVSAEEKLVVDVPAVDYPNIGFDGKWSTAAQLLDPEQIRRMQPSTRPAPAGTRWYDGGSRDARVQVLWDEKELYPRRIESSNPGATRRSSLVATREALPTRLPWTRLQDYQKKEYSDLLD